MKGGIRGEELGRGEGERERKKGNNFELGYFAYKQIHDIIIISHLPEG